MQSLEFTAQFPVAQRIGLYELHFDEIRGLINSNLESLNEFKSVFVAAQLNAEPTHLPSFMHMTGWFSGQYFVG